MNQLRTTSIALGFSLLAVAAWPQLKLNDSRQAPSSPTIVTVAGGGSISTDALSADIVFGSDASAVNDASGNFYIAATSGQYVFRVTPTGTLSIIAGSGYSGFSGDGGPAINAVLNNPAGISLDSQGNVYFADVNNDRVRKIDTNGNITTVAGSGKICPSSTQRCGDGGQATLAALNTPIFTAVDSAGNVYIADNGDNRIRKVTASTGTITTVAGSGNYCSGSSACGDGGLATKASFGGYLYGVNVDGSGNLYISDTANNRVRVVSGKAGVIQTIAGNGTPCGVPTGSCGDGRKSTAANLRSPEGTAVDGAGNLYIADSGDQKIRRVDASTHIISTVAGTGTSGYNGDGRLATLSELSFPATVWVNGTGSLTIADSNNGRVRLVVLGGSMSTVAGGGSVGDGGPASSANLGSPTGVALTASGYYVADANNSRIRFVNAQGNISTIAGTGAGGYTGDGGPATDAQIDNPFAVTVDRSGNVYFVDGSNNVIRRINSLGIITTVAGQAGQYCPFPTDPCGDNGLATSALLSFVTDVKVDSAGNLFIADVSDNRVRKVDTSGIITTVAGTGDYGFNGDNQPAKNAWLAGPWSLALDTVGNLYIADGGNCRVRRVDATTGNITAFAFNGTCTFGGNGGLAINASRAGAMGLALDAAGDLFIGGGTDEVVQVVLASSGKIVTVAGNPVNPTATGFSGDGGPSTKALLGSWGIGVSGTQLYIADWLNNRVRLVNLP